MVGQSYEFASFTEDGLAVYAQAPQPRGWSIPTVAAETQSCLVKLDPEKVAAARASHEAVLALFAGRLGS